MAAPMPPQQRQAPQFGTPSFGTEPPRNLQKKRQRDHDSESEKEGTCNECHRLKRSKHQRNNKRKAVDEAESESDEGDYKSLSRIALVSRRKRIKVCKKAFADFWSTEVNGMSFAVYAQKSPSVPGSQSQDEKKPLWSRPENGWKWPEKVVGGFKVTSPRQSEQNRPKFDENGHGEPLCDDPGVDSTSLFTHELATRENDHNKNVEDSKATSSEPDKLQSGRDRESFRAYDRISYSADREDEDEYVELDGVAYVIPAKNRAKRNLDTRDEYVDDPIPRYYEEPRPKRRAERHRLAREATEADATKHRIPKGYSLKNWDPTEEPILLLGSVFDANSLGKWILTGLCTRISQRHRSRRWRGICGSC